VTKAERLDALLARLDGLPARISALTVGIGHLRARRGEKDDDTWSVLQSLQDKARALGDEMFELWLEIGLVRDGRGPRGPGLGPKIGRPKPAAVDNARVAPEPAPRYKSRFLGGRY